jgi:serine/threonine protein phosphatase 1
MSTENGSTEAKERGQQEPGRLLAVGDIHGRLDLLGKLVRQVAPTPDDQVVFLGDYIDRGPEARGVIEFLLAFQRELPRSVFLEGNHEAMLLDYHEGRNRLFYIINGGGVTLASYRHCDQGRIPPEHLAFFRGLLPYYETDRFIFVHAGLRPGLAPARQKPEDLLWIRQEFLTSDYDWGKTVVFGHTPVAKPYFAAGRIGLDTGAGHGRALTCCEVRQQKCWTAS